jgi:glyceraldehyde 3-phosphate dehydrogenase
MAKVLHENIGIKSGLMTTIHAYTNDQVLTDVYHTDPYRARSATQSMIPTKTGAAAAIGLVMPELAGKFDGMAVRVPTINVSLVDLVFVPERPTDAAEINRIMQAAAKGSRILAYNDIKLVSIDFRHNPFSCIFDAHQTRCCEGQVKVMAWYDNEWAFANRMLDTGMAMVAAKG